MTNSPNERASIVCQDNKLILGGDLDFISVGKIYEASLGFLQEKANFVIDFAEVKSANSAGLALIVEWAKLSKQRSCQIQFINIPDNLQEIAKAADLVEVI